MGLVSKAKEQPDLLLPLLAPIPPLPGDVGTSEQRVSYPGEKEGFVLVWIPEQAQPRIREAPLLAQGRWWGLVAGEGLDHPVQQAHLIKSLWLLPETARRVLLLLLPPLQSCATLAVCTAWTDLTAATH